MKLRHPGLIKLAALLMAGIVRTLMSTIRTREYTFQPILRPDHPRNQQRYIYAFWHESILGMAGRYGHHANVSILISNHADGELIALVVKRMGMKMVRGSTARSGLPALLSMLAASKSGHLAITPDGPRGPRQQAQLGTLYLASRTGYPIVPIGVSYEKAWYAPSWDRMGIPWPFSRSAGIAGEPLSVPADLSKEELEPYARELEQRMHQATDQARLWLREKKW